MEIKDHIIGPEEYYNEIVKKNVIVLHHTAGGSNPINTIDGWDADHASDGSPLKVGTSFVIVRTSSGVSNAEFDGKIYRAFDEKFWCHHLGTKLANNRALNKQSIAIEICNYGGLTKSVKTGKYLSYVNREIDPAHVCDLGYVWRGYRYWEDYTVGQIAALKELMIYLGDKYGINIKRTVDASWFSLNKDAMDGKPGVWTHVNFRSDKTDCYPHPGLIQMLNSL